jgi:hypothetical protein
MQGVSSGDADRSKLGLDGRCCGVRVGKSTRGAEIGRIVVASGDRGSGKVERWIEYSFEYTVELGKLLHSNACCKQQYEIQVCTGASGYEEAK